MALAGEGVRVVLSGRRRPELERTAKMIEDGGGVAVIEPLDVTDKAAVEAVARRIDERWGRCDILVNSAGREHPRPALA